MPKTKSARKSFKISLRNRKINLFYLGQIKKLRRKLKKVSKTNIKEFKKNLSLYYKYVDKTAKKKIISKNKAKRLKSQATKIIKVKSLFKKTRGQRKKKK